MKNDETPLHLRLTKIRVNFKNENLIEGVNMSILADLLVQQLTQEQKEKLQKATIDEYEAIIT